MVAVPLILLCGLAGLAALPKGSGQKDAARDAADVITHDSYFYGQSPPVYPSPDMTGVGDWAVAFNKARALVANMTLDEKVSLTTGVSKNNGCSGNIPEIKRLGFPGMCLSDAGNGLRATDFVSSFPSGIHAAASWNKDLTFQRGAAMGNEFKAKGVNVILGPVVGPMGRVIESGRIWEGMCIDPYLSGTLASETVSGIQGQGVITSVKHFILNEQETNRVPSGNTSSVSSNIDDKTIHELYLWPFQDAVKAGAGNIMCSYQRINNSYSCSNSKTLNGLLKTELGFQGFVVSDWGAQHAGVATALAGLDMAMPSGGDYWGKTLTESIRNGSVPESRVTDMATRILTSWYQFNQDANFKEPGHGMPADITAPHQAVDGRDPNALPVISQGAAEGHVLVKNIKDTLPLKSPRMLSVYGYSAKSPDLFALSSGIMGTFAWEDGTEPSDPMNVISGFSGDWSVKDSPIAQNGTMLNGGGSGATTPAVFVSPFDALKMRAYSDRTALSYDFLSSVPLVDSAADACLVFGNAWASEGSDRPAIRDDYTDGLIKAVADQCNKTIVVLHNAGVRLVDQFVDHPNVSAIIFAHLPGQASGEALVSILYGETNPSGKLPYTVARNESDYADLLHPALAENRYEYFPQSDFDEGVYVDYRRFDKNDITPRYEFGFGMSYTTFDFSSLTVQAINGTNTAELPTGAVITGGQADLWDSLYTISANVQNTGKVAGAEVAQLYIGIPNAPAKQLRGFEKPELQPNQTAAVSFGLMRRDLSVWDTEAQKWRLQPGTYQVFVGSSSRQLPLKGSFTI